MLRIPKEYIELLFDENHCLSEFRRMIFKDNDIFFSGVNYVKISLQQ